MKPFHHSEVHRKKIKKNMAVLSIVFGLCALIWVVSMIKMSGG